MVGAILGGLLFGFFAEGLLLQTTILAAKMLVFLFQDRDPLQRTGMHAFPIADLLPKFEVLLAQRANFVAKLRYFRTQFANARHPVADNGVRTAFFKQKAIHDLSTLPLDRRFRKEQLLAKRVGRSFTFHETQVPPQNGFT